MAPMPPRKHSALLLGLVAVALGAEARPPEDDEAEEEDTAALRLLSSCWGRRGPLSGGSYPSSRVRLTVMPRQNEGEASDEDAPLQRSRASLQVPFRSNSVTEKEDIGGVRVSI